MGQLISENVRTQQRPMNSGGANKALHPTPTPLLRYGEGSGELEH